MLSLIGHGLALVVEPSSLIHLLIGVVLGLVIGVIPGLGGVQAMAILIPFIYSMSPEVALSFLIGAHVTTQYAGSVTSILMDIPPSGTNVATCWDGYPLARKGRAMEALGIGATCNVIGAWFGALVLMVSIPVLARLVSIIQPPELFMVAMLGLTLVASLAGKSLVKGLISGLLGLALTFIGRDPVTGVARFTFGQPYLMDGLDLVTVIVGMYAVGEMIRLFTRGDKSIAEVAVVDNFKGVWTGIMQPFKHWWKVLYASLIGTVIGIVPGVGGTVANILAYGQIQQISKNPETFGTGRVEGLIGPESSHISKEGGQMIPTLALGVPGGDATAVLLGALLILGLQPGPSLIHHHVDLIYAVVMIIAGGSLLASVFGLLAARYLSKITLVPVAIITPVIVMLAVSGAFASTTNVLSVIVALAFGIFGYFMRRYGYSEASLIIGLVLGVIVQPNLNIALRLYGWSFIWQRPICLGLAIVTALVLVVTLAVRLRSEGKKALNA